MLIELLQKLFGTAVGRACTNAYCKLAIPDNAVYCEKPTGGIVERPGYAISNVPYLLLGIYLFFVPRNTLAKLFGVASFLIGFCSLMYDVTYTRDAQYFDWLGMFFFLLLIICLNIRRIMKLPGRGVVGVFVLTYLAYIVSTYFLGVNFAEIVYAGGVLLIIVTEVLIRARSDKKYNLAPWMLAVTLFFVGWAIWQLDSHQIWCDPNNLFNGRGIFHYFTTVCIYLLYRFYLQFDLLKTRPLPA